MGSYLSYLQNNLLIFMKIKFNISIFAEAI
jgi:hypothetical protein